MFNFKKIERVLENGFANCNHLVIAYDFNTKEWKIGPGEIHKNKYNEAFFFPWEKHKNFIEALNKFNEYINKEFEEEV